QALQNAMKKGQKGRLAYFLFDLPYYDGYDLTQAPLIERKAMLKGVLDGAPPDETIHFSDHVVGHGPTVLKAACRKKVEGIVSKRADSPYEQTRSHRWLKIKCLKRQEFVIGGYTDPTGSRTGSFGSLLLGYYDKQKQLSYCGRVGTGFTAES